MVVKQVSGCSATRQNFTLCQRAYAQAFDYLECFGTCFADSRRPAVHAALAVDQYAMKSPAQRLWALERALTVMTGVMPHVRQDQPAVCRRALWKACKYAG